MNTIDNALNILAVLLSLVLMLVSIDYIIATVALLLMVIVRVIAKPTYTTI